MVYRDLLTTSGISLVVSSVVVLLNNYFLYRHCCKTEQSKEQSKEQLNK
jgi:hypothetical protein